MAQIEENIYEKISITINENDIENGALKILKIIRPQWEPSRIKFKLLTDGITNKLLSCRPEYLPENETILVRIYGNKTDLMIDRKAETRNICMLNKHNLAPNLYATFENGLAYQFQPGSTLNTETVRNPKIYSLVAKHMAQLHKVKVNNGIDDKPKPFIWKKCRDFLNLVPEEFSNLKNQIRFDELSLPTQSELNIEIIHLQNVLEMSKCPIVFCHNDLLLGNVIYTSETDHITFIDYEYAAFNYQPYDIANHFAEFVGMNLDSINYETLFPNKDFQLDWIRIYLTEFNNGSIPTEKEILNLYIHVNKFVLVSHIFWGIWGLIQAEHSNINFDYMRFAKIRLDQYFANKEKLLALKLPNL